MERDKFGIRVLNQVMEFDMPQDGLAAIEFIRRKRGDSGDIIICEPLGRILITFPKDKDQVWAVREHGEIEML